MMALRLFRPLVGILILLLGQTASTVLRINVPRFLQIQGGVSVPASLDAWTFYDPYDPTVSNLLQTGADGYFLDPTWQVDKIELLFQWSGMGMPAFDDQTVRRQGDGYVNGSTPVDRQRVTAFLRSIAHLYPNRLSSFGITFLESNPSWAIELTGTDGQHLLLYSSTTATTGSAPWNIYYNGRLDAQYDGTLAEPLSQLFDDPRVSPLLDPSAPVTPPDQMRFLAGGYPSQMIYGFSGLLPVAERFDYQADGSSGSIQGHLQGVRLGQGERISGGFSVLTRVELTLSDGTSLDCALQRLPNDSPYSQEDSWTFSCPVSGAVEGQSYRYPIRLEFDSGQGASVSAEGELQGKWKNPSAVLLTPLPEVIQKALNSAEATRDLLTDHVAVDASYTEQNMLQSPETGEMTGALTLLGQSQIGAATIRYTVGAQFSVRDGSLIHWNLTRSILDDLVADVAAQPITRRVVEANPTTIVNLWYQDNQRAQDSQALTSYRFCGIFPAGTLPDAQTPYRAFDFNRRWAYDSPSFVLFGSTPVVANLTIRSDDAVLLSLLPEQLASGAHVSFERITVYPTFDPPEVEFSLSSSASSADRESLRSYLNSIHGSQLNTDNDQYWTLKDATMRITDDGRLELAACGQ